MSEQALAQAKPQSISKLTSVSHGILQRCSNGVKCEECRKKREGTMRRIAIRSDSTTVHPPKASIRSFTESRFSHDFSTISNHTTSTGNIGSDASGAAMEPQDAGTPDASKNLDAATNKAIKQPATQPNPVIPDISASQSATQARKQDAPTEKLSWSQVLLFPYDALWFFCGEHPAGFSTKTTLKASGFNDPAHLKWRITHGADKIAFQDSPVGANVVVKSIIGSSTRDDVSIEIREGTQSFTGKLTVRKPHHLIQRFVHDKVGLPPDVACPMGCVAPCGFWTEIGYRVVDNVGGTIVGAPVNENFPGGEINDQPNNWFVPVPNGDITDGTFPDNWAEGGCAASGTNPIPVGPTSPNAGQSVDRIPHEFFVGSVSPGKGCRVQKHTAHRYLGFARHEDITTPAP